MNRFTLANYYSQDTRPGAGVLRRVALVELSRPMDESSEQLAAAHTMKLCTYRPLTEELQPYVDRRDQVEILHWVVGVHGLLDSSSITRILDFLLVQ